MRVPFSSAVVLLAAGAARAASSWSFDDGVVSVATKKDPESGAQEKLKPKIALAAPLTLSSDGIVKISLTTKDNGKAKRAHQAFVMLKEEESGLEAPFPLTLRDTGKATGLFSQKDIPVQLLLSSKPLKASLVLGSFGSATGLVTDLFNLEIKLDPSMSAPTYEQPERYGKKPEIHHIFRADPRSPPKIVSLFFTLAILAAVPALLFGWLALGANANHLGKALGAAPLSHISFLGSLIAMECVFFQYYSSWNLFQTLPVIGFVGFVTLLSGTKALGEVQGRRLAGHR